jgi:hypothetical protein
MSWVVLESWEDQTTNRTVDADGIKGTSTVRRTFNVTPPGPVTTVEVSNAPGLPLINSPHPVSPALRARTIDVDQRGPFYFIVTVGYEAATRDPEDPSQNPLTLPPVITFSSVTQEVEIDEDVNGDKIQTVNAEPLVGVTRPFTDLVITVQRNLPTFNPNSISEYMNKVNSTAWYGLPAGTVKISDIQARSVFSEDFAYWDVSISFQVRRGFGSVTDAKAWYFRTAHQGYRVRVSTGPPLVTDTAKDGDFTVAQPVMLIMSGVDIGKREPDPTVGHFIEFEVLESIDFNTLNLL